MTPLPVSVRTDSLVERSEFELPVPICEPSDDRYQVKVCDIENDCKALSPCHFWCALGSLGATGANWPVLCLIRCRDISRDVVHRARGEGLLRILPTVKADQAFEPRAIPTLRLGAGPRRHVGVWWFRNRYWQFEFTSLHRPVPRVSDISENRSKSGERDTGAGVRNFPLDLCGMGSNIEENKQRRAGTTIRRLLKRYCCRPGFLRNVQNRTPVWATISPSTSCSNPHLR
jgi:hypothetical protein